MSKMGLLDFLKSKPQIQPVDEPIEGHKLLNVFNNVKVRRMGIIPEDTQIGDKVVLLYQPASKDVIDNISLLLVPKKKLFGYIDDDPIIEKELVRCIKRSDKSVARISYFSKKKMELNATVNIAFFKKNK